MPTPETLERFISLVEANAHAEAVEAFYAPEAAVRENQSEPRVGRGAAMAREHAIHAKARSMTSRCVRPALVHGDHVAIRWVFDFEWLDGSTTHMEEVAWQYWEGERLLAETFFYDPAQRTPHKAER